MVWFNNFEQSKSYTKFSKPRGQLDKLITVVKLAESARKRAIVASDDNQNVRLVLPIKSKLSM